MGTKKRIRKRKLSVLEDYDQDGVPNFDDCQPLDPTQHGGYIPSGGGYSYSYKRRTTGGYTPSSRGGYTYTLRKGLISRTTVLSGVEARRGGYPTVYGTLVGTPMGESAYWATRGMSHAMRGATIGAIEKSYRAPETLTSHERALIEPHLSKFSTAFQRKFRQAEMKIRMRDVQEEMRPERMDVTRGKPVVPMDVPGVTTSLLYGVTPQTKELAEQTWSRISKIRPISIIEKGIAISPFGVSMAPVMVTAKRALPTAQQKLTSMYESIAPPPEQRLYEQQFREMETGVSAFETKWQPYVKEERFVGTEIQYKQMVKEHTALEAQLPDFERMQQQMSGVQYKKAERKLADYKTGWIYTGTEKFLETMYPPYVRKAQEAVSGWQREIGYKPSEHPILKEIEHAQWYVAKELPGMVLRGGAMIPPAFEAVIHKPKEREKMEAAVIPGLAFMGKGMIEEAQREPLGFVETMGITILAPKAAVRVSPIKPMYMKVPTGKSLMKTYTTIGKGVPSEFKALKEAAGPFSAVELGKVEPTWMRGIYKQTHLIPEMATYRGLRLSLPSEIPYKGKSPLMGVVTRPPGIGIKRIEAALGTPEFEMPTQFRVFTGPEAALVMPSMRKMLKGDELVAWESAMYLQETFGRKRPIVRDPIRIGELEHLKEAFGGTEGLQEFTRYVQKHRRHMLVYGSAAKQVQLARPELITPKDIDIEIRSIAAHLGGLTTETKVPLRTRLTPFEVEMAHRISRKMPGLTPEQVAADLATISKKHLSADDVQVTFKPAWQMFSVEKVLKTMEKTSFGMQPEVMTLADIHPPSGLFEFGLKPQRAIKVPVISGLPSEKMPFFSKRIKITPLGEEFERGFGSIIQMAERRGEVIVGPKPKRIKDIGRFVQTGKMLVVTERLRAELGLGILRKGRMRKVEKGREALAFWEERALKAPELKEMVPGIKAEAMLPGMESVLKHQMKEHSLMMSERAALGPGYKLPIHDVPLEISKTIDTSAYYPKIAKRVVPSDYYPKLTPLIDSSYYTQKMVPVSGYDYYPKPAPTVTGYDYYGMPTRKHISRRGAFTPFMGISMPSFGVGIPKMVGMPTFKLTPTQIPVPKMITGVPTPTTTFVPPPGMGVAPPPPTTPVWSPPPPTTIRVPPPFPPTTTTTIWVPPPTITQIFPLLPSKEKPRRRKKKYKYEDYPWKERHYIPTLQELMKLPEGMTVTTSTAFVEPKMPKLPKGLM